MQKIIIKSLSALGLAALASSAFAQAVTPPPAIQQQTEEQRRLKVEASPNNPFKKAGSDDLPSGPAIGGDYQGALPLEILLGTNDLDQAPKLLGTVNGQPFIQHEGKFLYGTQAQSIYQDAMVAKIVMERRARDAKLKEFLAKQKAQKKSAN